MNDQEKHEEWETVVQAFAGMSGNGWLRTNCTLCESKTGKPDHKSSLGYNPITSGYNCFKCSSSGKLPRSYRERLHSIEAESVYGPEVPPMVEAPEGYTTLFEGPAVGSLWFKGFRDYLLIKRGLTELACREAKVGAAYAGKFAGRIIVPIFDYSDPNRSWRGWVGRDCTGMSDLPYRYSRGMKRDGLLYNEPALYVETTDPVYVVEGTLDALALWPDAVAVLGKPLDSQTELLQKAQRPVVLCLDGDAWEEGWALTMKLRFLGVHAGNVKLPPKTDPDEVPRAWLDEEARRALEEA